MSTPPRCAASAEDLEAIARFNRTDAVFPADRTIVDLFEQSVATHPDRTAVVLDHDRDPGPGSLDYRRLNAWANRLAGVLCAHGVGPGSVVALHVERSLEMVVGILGVLKAGGAYLPISTALPPARVEYMLGDARTTVLLVKGARPGSFRFDGLVVDLGDSRLHEGDPPNPDRAAAPGDLAYVIYTSGSTGRPKGVMVEHRALVNRLNWMQRAYPIGPDDVILQKTPYSFDVSVWELLWWALAGASVCMLAPGGERFPLSILNAIAKRQVSVVHFVPSMLNVFLDYLEDKPARTATALTSLKRVFASGEALAPGHVGKFNALLASRTASRLTNLYGPTEATVDVTYFDCPAEGAPAVVPIGRPIDNTRLYVLRGSAMAPVGEVGELCIAGVGLARGYLNNPALTAERFVDNPANPGERIYRTGDLARWRADGNVEYLGRDDDQVKIRGLRIELGEIENSLREHPGVSDCVATVRRPSEEVAHILAFVVPRSDLDLGELRDFLKVRLPDYMVPTRIERIAAVPLTANGKADRAALPDSSNDGVETS
jgi:amino acid adenylation domain-containing protein